MKLFQKSALSAALATALLGGLVVSQPAMAASDSGAVAANLPYVNVNGLGQALIYPYYSVREGNNVSFNIFNTSDTHAVAVKVRFREYQNSRDVFDFNVVLSPNDKYFGNLLPSADGGVRYNSIDNTCTVPQKAVLNANDFTDFGYTGEFTDAGDMDIARLEEGYIEVISMAWSDVTSDPVFAGALHNAQGVPGNCNAVEAAFDVDETLKGLNAWDATDTTPGNGLPAIAQDADWTLMEAGENPLFGELLIRNTNEGTGGGTNAIAIADWMAKTAANGLSDINGDLPVNLATAQVSPYFLEPTLATSAGPWDTANRDDVNAALAASTVINEWADNSVNLASTDWVVTMPTKSFHVDQYAGNVQAGVSVYRPLAASGMAPFENNFALQQGEGVAEVTYELDLWNSEEGLSVEDTVSSIGISPGGFAEPELDTLKYEANVITFADDAAEFTLKPANPEDASGVVSNLPQANPVNTQGWAKLNLKTGPIDDLEATNFPVVGFAFKSRKPGGAGVNFGQMLDHKFIVEPAAAPAVPVVTP